MDEFSVTPLGTVSPNPTLECNCPGVLVQSGKNKILLDCGSGVSKYFSKPEDLNNLMIFLSHFHLDHYSDLGNFVYSSYVYKNLGMLNQEIQVYYPYDKVKNKNKLKDFMDISFMKFNSYNDLTNLKVGNVNISFLRNLHDIVTYSVKIMSNDVSVVYTADTGYNDSLVKFCENVDLLISESSLLKEHNSVKGHMYAFEAGKLAKEAKVKQLMLTHFFPNIPKEYYVKEAKEYFENTIAAVEGETLCLRKGKF